MILLIKIADGISQCVKNMRIIKNDRRKATARYVDLILKLNDELINRISD